MKHIVEYSKEWSAWFREIRSYLERALPPGCTAHHVGSTSVPGMPGKNIIDLDIECPAGSMSKVIKCLSNIGYAHEGDKGISGREAFVPATHSPAASLPCHHLYACETGASELKKHLAYREYLKAHPDRAAWLAEKKIASDSEAKSREEYILNKEPFYEIIARESLEWANYQIQTDAFGAADS